MGKTRGRKPKKKTSDPATDDYKLRDMLEAGEFRAGRRRGFVGVARLRADYLTLFPPRRPDDC